MLVKIDNRIARQFDYEIRVSKETQVTNVRKKTESLAETRRATPTRRGNNRGCARTHPLPRNTNWPPETKRIPCPCLSIRSPAPHKHALTLRNFLPPFASLSSKLELRGISIPPSRRDSTLSESIIGLFFIAGLEETVLELYLSLLSNFKHTPTLF